jgi:hypothetical protein
MIKRALIFLILLTAFLSACASTTPEVSPMPDVQPTATPTTAPDIAATPVPSPTQQPATLIPAPSPAPTVAPTPRPLVTTGVAFYPHPRFTVYHEAPFSIQAINPYPGDTVYVPTLEQREELHRILRFEEWKVNTEVRYGGIEVLYSIRTRGDTWAIAHWDDDHVIINPAKTCSDCPIDTKCNFLAPVAVLEEFSEFVASMTPLPGTMDMATSNWFDLFRWEPTAELLCQPTITDVTLFQYAAIQLVLAGRSDRHDDGYLIEDIQKMALRHFGREIADWEGLNRSADGTRARGMYFSFNNFVYLVPWSIERRPDGSYDGYFDAYNISDSWWWDLASDSDHPLYYGLREHLLTGNTEMYPEPQELWMHFSVVFGDGAPYFVYHEISFS